MKYVLLCPPNWNTFFYSFLPNNCLNLHAAHSERYELSQNILLHEKFVSDIKYKEHSNV
jgi:hypothetical protein